jgi:hypothetical protein
MQPKSCPTSSATRSILGFRSSWPCGPFVDDKVDPNAKLAPSEIPKQLAEMYWIAFGRPPSDTELAAAKKLLSKYRPQPLVTIRFHLAFGLQHGDRAIAEIVVERVQCALDNACRVGPRAALRQQRFKCPTEE